MPSCRTGYSLPIGVAGSSPAMTVSGPSPVRRGSPAEPSRVQLGQDLDDLLLAVDDLHQEALAVEVAVLVPGGVHQDAGLVLGLDGHAVEGVGEGLAVELPELLGDVLDRVDRRVALDAVVVRHVVEALLELL